VNLRTFAVALVTLVLAAVATLVLLVPGSPAFVDRTIVPFWATALLRLGRVRFTVTGRDRIPPGPVVFIANHRSHYDIPVLWLALGRPFRFVAKRELASIPFFGWALRLLGHVMIDRGDSARARDTMAEAAVRVRDGVSVLVFPEGTRGEPQVIARERVASFKKGGIILAIRAGVPIVPVAISGTEAILPKGALGVRPGTARVVIGEPILTAGLVDADRDRTTREVRARIIELLDPATAPAAAQVPT
jgi:1-acyl-sn-glycerol-3-phosphate acyltransferase